MTLAASGLGNLTLSPASLDALAPMHIVLDGEGMVRQAGSTLCKLLAKQAGTPEAKLVGANAFDLLEIRRPHAVTSVALLSECFGQRLDLRLKSFPEMRMRGQALPIAQGGGAFLNISLGVSFAETVERCDLTLSDFSPCDSTIELLYLREAIVAVSQESQNLTNRLILAEQAAQAQAKSDALTGLANRRALDGELQRLLASDVTFTLMHLDLDFFKEINDELGHAAGDMVLKRVGEVLRDEVREHDLAVRIGGDEFVLVLRNCDDPVYIQRIAKRVIGRLEEPMMIADQARTISASAGSTRSTLYDQPNAETMLHDADFALYASKRAGRAKHTFYRPGMAHD